MSSPLSNEKKVMKLKPYAEVRRDFSEALQQQLRSQGPVTKAAIQRLQQSRKYAHSPVSAMRRD